MRGERRGCSHVLAGQSEVESSVPLPGGTVEVSSITHQSLQHGRLSTVGSKVEGSQSVCVVHIHFTAGLCGNINTLFHWLCLSKGVQWLTLNTQVYTP